MIIKCVWEHNGDDSLLYVDDLPGAYTRGESFDVAKSKMAAEICSYLKWTDQNCGEEISLEVVQEAECELNIKDADSDVIFSSELEPLTLCEYMKLKELALKSAVDFQRLYDSIPDIDFGSGSGRRTFYGQVPRSAREMYEHTRSVNSYYFGEIDVAADNVGKIVECRVRGFDALELPPNFLMRPAIEGSYGEMWSIRKVLRRFIWHDRIHAKAMYRMAVTQFGHDVIEEPFCFSV